MNLPKPSSPEVARLRFNPEDQANIAQIQINLDYLSNIFSVNPETSMLCGHCLHKMKSDGSNAHFTEMDYAAILMATDRSWAAVMNYIREGLTPRLIKEVETWKLDEVNMRRNQVRQQIQEETESFYTTLTSRN